MHQVADQAVALALSTFSRIDGLLLNHGTLDPVTSVASASAAAWRASFDTNFFSIVAFVTAALPALRATQGRIVFTSSGAAAGAYASWGAYGAAKAAMNHLAMTLAVEEPDVTSVSVRPGVVDTQMQQAIREVHAEAMDGEDAKKFKSLHEEGGLLRPEQPGHVMAQMVLNAPRELSGKFLRYVQDESHGDGPDSNFQFFSLFFLFLKNKANVCCVAGMLLSWLSFRIRRINCEEKTTFRYVSNAL